MDLTAFAVACMDDHPLLRSILQRYTDFTCEVLDRACRMGVDFVWSFDDFAFNSNNNVPDTGTTFALFGIALLGLFGASRYRRVAVA